jgi:hypothetical protein
MSKLEVLSVKVYPEVKQKFTELFELAETGTQGSFVELLLEHFENPRKIEVEKEENVQLINSLKQRNSELEIDLEAIEVTRVEQENEIEQLNIKIAELEGREPEKIEIEKKLEANQFIITAHPFIAEILNEICTLESKRKKQEIKPERLLLELFWNVIQNPTVNHLPKVYTSSELRMKMKKHEQAVQ